MATTSQGYKVNKQPIAQSFFIDEVAGIYVTKVDLYFAEKDASFPVSLQIRPMVNGYPSSSEIVPGSQVVLSGASVNTSADATSATTFQFDEPIFLKGLTDYAIVLHADSVNYEVYIAQLNDFLLNSTEKRINRQPVLGSLFYSQNSSTFTPAQNQDLTFKLYQAKFRYTSGEVVLHNAAVPKQLLVTDPLTTVASSSTVTVAHYNHGLQIGETVNISGVDSAGVGGISYSSLVGDRTVVAVDYTGYTFAADSAADSDVIGGGSNILATKNIPFSVLYPNVSYLQPSGTVLAYAAKGTTGKSYAGSETAFQKASDYAIIGANKNNEADNIYLIANSTSETSELGAGVKSLDIKVGFSTIDSNVSPMLDMQRTSASLINYVIDRQDSAASSGFNVPLNFVSETLPTGGSSATKHITRAITLVEDSVGIKVIFAANRPSASDFELYYRVASGDEILSDKNWVLATEETSNPTDERRTTLREYRYLIGGQAGNLPAFTQMQFKIVFRSTNTARVPYIKDLRVIALGV